MIMNCTGFMVTMLVFYGIISFLFFTFIIIQCLPFVANKSVHNVYSSNPGDKWD